MPYWSLATRTLPDFAVAVLAEIQPAAPDADPIGYGQVRDALGAAIGDDVQAVLTAGLRARAKPLINRAMVDRIVQPE